ncbi:VOC family protein [Balneolaceae bacterium YR4-1]|uniref:VOC family protein n=1 Tax=Halalkalibaculum roseum TaxID=2709311 RepID=A0A6M1T9K8_9BACT|nr:VOC family protein [Halalkalibaculum roseum]NGP76893.1 VOC family protein [Halalkalibaculum roseum]
MEKIISGIQQIGIGTPNEKKAFEWYRKHLGMDICVFQDSAEASLMSGYTGDKVQSRSATLAMNLQGGGGLEVWQYTSRNTEPPSFNVQLGDLGVYGTRIKCKNLKQTYEFLKSRDVRIVNGIEKDPSGSPHFFVKDPHGLVIQMVTGNSWFSNGSHHSGGIAGCMIGVSDIDRSMELYHDILEYDEIEYDVTGVFDDLKGLDGSDQKIRRVLLSHSQPRKGSFSQLLGPSKIELIQTFDREPRRIFGDRYWGDLGYIHLCFDVKGMDQLKKECNAKGFKFTVDSKNSFDMGEAAGRFSYIEDPDGTLIEFVETHKIPIWENVGWYLDVKNKPPEKPIPKWMLQFLRLSRVK